MSICDFYVDNFIDPNDPASFDAYMQGMQEGHSDGALIYAAERDHLLLRNFLLLRRLPLPIPLQRQALHAPPLS